jgi:hypothetical protein
LDVCRAQLIDDLFLGAQLPAPGDHAAAFLHSVCAPQASTLFLRFAATPTPVFAIIRLLDLLDSIDPSHRFIVDPVLICRTWEGLRARD